MSDKRVRENEIEIVTYPETSATFIQGWFPQEYERQRAMKELAEQAQELDMGY
jgi:hypothetical protein